jgi:hypothetical protein
MSGGRQGVRSLPRQGHEPPVVREPLVLGNGGFVLSVDGFGFHQIDEQLKLLRCEHRPGSGLGATRIRMHRTAPCDSAISELPGHELNGADPTGRARTSVGVRGGRR